MSFHAETVSDLAIMCITDIMINTDIMDNTDIIDITFIMDITDIIDNTVLTRKVARFLSRFLW
jgi:hypothetical protein